MEQGIEYMTPSEDDAELFNALERWYSNKDIGRQRLAAAALNGETWAQRRIRDSLFDLGKMDPTRPWSGPGDPPIARASVPDEMG